MIKTLITMFTQSTTAAWVVAGLAGAVAATEAPLAMEYPVCGDRATVPLSFPEKAGRRLSLERLLNGGGVTHCGYFLARACMEWETRDPGAGLQAFEMAFRFCDDKTIAARGKVAARLDREDFAGAYVALMDGVGEGGVDSLALAPFERAVFGGLSLTDFPTRGPDAYRLAPAALDPEMAYRLSLLPGAGFLYAGEGRLALQHMMLGLGLSALAGWRIREGFRGWNHEVRMAAFMDAGVVTLFLWRRFYLGGMAEARRIAREKNRSQGAARVRAMWSSENPFAPMQTR